MKQCCAGRISTTCSRNVAEIHSKLGCARPTTSRMSEGSALQAVWMEPKDLNPRRPDGRGDWTPDPVGRSARALRTAGRSARTGRWRNDRQFVEEGKHCDTLPNRGVVVLGTPSGRHSHAIELKTARIQLLAKLVANQGFINHCWFTVDAICPRRIREMISKLR